MNEGGNVMDDVTSQTTKKDVNAACLLSASRWCYKEVELWGLSSWRLSGHP